MAQTTIINTPGHLQQEIIETTSYTDRGTRGNAPASLIFVRICPPDLCNIVDVRLISHVSNLAFSSQITSEGFYPNGPTEKEGHDGGVGPWLYTLNGDIFDDIFFARKDAEEDPLFAIKESDARKIIFSDTPLGSDVLYKGSPVVNGPVITFRGDVLRYTNWTGGTQGLKHYDPSFKGINLMDTIVRAIEYDLEAEADKWDTSSYANIVSLLQPLRSLSNLLGTMKSVICASLSRKQIAYELAKIYDAANSIMPEDTNSAQRAVYSVTSSQVIWNKLMEKLDGTTTNKIGYLAISVLFRNTTPKAKDYDFRIHIKISSHPLAMGKERFLSQYIPTSGFQNNVKTYDASGNLILGFKADGATTSGF
jgi:hypothetical protein